MKIKIFKNNDISLKIERVLNRIFVKINKNYSFKEYIKIRDVYQKQINYCLKLLKQYKVSFLVVREEM